MPYRYSQIDRKNLDWFLKDMSKATLASIELIVGHMRGLYPFSLEFSYPLSVIAGKNGSGKSTVLAMAACAFHNKRRGFKLPTRKMPYYTFSDFFIQSSEEIAPEGILIAYNILWDNWRPTINLPKGMGKGRQTRRKKRGGKWTNYASRANRDVVFFGIERVVPHSEKSISRSYRNCFIEDEEEGYEIEVKDVVGKILRKPYDRFWYTKHSKYRLPHVSYRGVIYSGFNMGAGENALFDIFSTIFSSPTGLLIIIDEIELGLHEDAQKRFVRELKKVCRDRHIQIVATTHSPTILKSVPPEARFFISAHKNETRVIDGISPLYAAGLLSSENSNELDIYVEDNISENIVHSLLDNETRKRVNIIPIGSSIAVIRQMAALFKNPKEGDCLAILDGDQSRKQKRLKEKFTGALETGKSTVSASDWFESRVMFLPSKTWPERWLVEKLIESDTETLAKTLQIDDVSFKDYLEESLSEGKHQEIHCLSENLCIKDDNLCCILSRWAADNFQDDFDDIICTIKNSLNGIEEYPTNR